MKKKKLIFTLLACLLTVVINAQNKQDRINLQLDKISTIVIKELIGSSIVMNSEVDEIKFNSNLYVKGDNWGFKFPQERPEFKIKANISNDTLFISSPNAFRYKTVGVSTYKEEISNIIQMPAGKNVIIKKADNLTIENRFLDIQVDNARFIECNNLHKQSLKTLQGVAGNQLMVNNVMRQKSFEFEGNGTERYLLKAEKIIINMD